MTRAANLFHYCSSRAYNSSEDLKDGARRLFGIAYEIIWAPVTVPKAAISYGLSLPLTRALVLLPLHLVQRTRSVGAPRCHIDQNDTELIHGLSFPFSRCNPSFSLLPWR